MADKPLSNEAAAAGGVGVVDVAVIGAGFGGLGAAVALQTAGFDSFVVLERADRVGGTWRDNTYPGCACDIPSHLYSFSFHQNPAWTRSYPAQPEIEAYLGGVVDRFALASHLRLGVGVAALHWDEVAASWRIVLDDGADVWARFVISATGPLSRPLVPDIAGLDRFAGTTFHSARWRHDHDLAGERVGVVGTGASAVQLVPQIAPVAARTTVFQRTAPWVMPRDDRPSPEWRRRLYARVPFLQRLHRWRIYVSLEMVVTALIGRGRVGRLVSEGIRRRGLAHLAASVADPERRALLTPSYAPGCKRLVIASDWYPALERSDVELVTESIIEVVPEGVRTADGALHPLDTLVLATGFAATEFPAPMRIFGRDGVEIARHWDDGARTHLGITVSGFPNLFLIVGPGTGLGHSSLVFMIEAQLNHVIGALCSARSTGVAAYELRRDVEARSYEELQERVSHTVWSSGCSSWYRSADGRVDTLWPGSTIEYWWRTRRFDPQLYEPRPRRFGEGPAAR